MLNEDNILDPVFTIIESSGNKGNFLLNEKAKKWLYALKSKSLLYFLIYNCLTKILTYAQNFKYTEFFLKKAVFDKTKMFGWPMTTLLLTLAEGWGLF